jgi:hypothetical protein
MFKYKRIQLARSETTVFAFDVPPWEIPVLAAVNGGETITEIGETPVRRELPDPATEYARLEAKYKVETTGGQSFVSLVYGVGQKGIAALATEIAKAKESAAEPPRRAAEYDAKDDPLLGLFEDPTVAEEATEIGQ